MIFISNAAVRQPERLLKFETSGFYQNEYALLLWTKVQYLACIFFFLFFWNSIIEMHVEYSSLSPYLSLHSGLILGCGSDLWKHHQPDILNHIIDSLNFIHFLWARVTVFETTACLILVSYWSLAHLVSILSWSWPQVLNMVKRIQSYHCL